MFAFIPKCMSLKFSCTDMISSARINMLSFIKSESSLTTADVVTLSIFGGILAIGLLFGFYRYIVTQKNNREAEEHSKRMLATKKAQQEALKQLRLCNDNYREHTPLIVFESTASEQLDVILEQLKNTVDLKEMIDSISEDTTALEVELDAHKEM